jgi:OHCU decarboxylase
MVSLRPFACEADFRNAADQVWKLMEKSDWLEAFACHPRIGQRPPAENQSAAWSRQEQSSIDSADRGILTRIAAGNQLYEDRFGFTFIVCATGKNPVELLEVLERRSMQNRETELLEAAEQQRQIMLIRIDKWLHS